MGNVLGFCREEAKPAKAAAALRKWMHRATRHCCCSPELPLLAELWGLSQPALGLSLP